jgi:AraC family transcriptional regulator
MDESTRSIFVSAVNYIYDRLDQPLTLDEIASASRTSVSSLKRIFQEVTDQSPGVFIRRLRMENAFRFLHARNQSVLETALASGFDDHSAFSRRFRETFGYSPVQARQKMNIVSELENVTLEEPDLIDLVPLKLQSVTCQGLYFDCAPKAWDGLKSNLNEEELSDAFSGLFVGIGHDNPHGGEVQENQVRFTAGICLAQRDLGLDSTTLAGGRYARFRYLGKVVNLGLAYHYIYGKWIKTPGVKVRPDMPAFMVFDRFPTLDGELRILIHVPIEG